jgi:hypothetical protein
MKILSNYSRIAQAFEACLQSIIGQGITTWAALKEKGECESEMLPLLEAALWLKQHQTAVDPRPGYINASGKRVLEKIRKGVEGRYNSGVKGGMQLRFAFRSALAICLALVLLLNTSVIATASRAASPGHFFYSVKKAEENVQLALIRSPEQIAGLNILMMKRRAAEIEELLLEGRYEYIEATALEFEFHLVRTWTAIDYWRMDDFQGANKKAEEIRSYLNNQVLVWQTLLQTAPCSGKESLAPAIQAAKQ